MAQIYFAYSLSDFRHSPNIDFKFIHTKKAWAFARSFDFLRFWTTLLTQMYARKTHANT